MAYVPAVVASCDSYATTSRPRTRGLFRRIYEAIAASQQRRAEQHIARFLEGRGNWMNDETEREIERRFLLSRSDLP